MIVSTRRSKLDILLGALCLLSNAHQLLVAACGGPEAFGPDAMTNAFGKSIPQTCITVPVDNGYVSTVTERCYYTYVPDAANCPAGKKKTKKDGPKKTKVPLVVDVHGLNSCPTFHAGYSGWIQKAEDECVVVVFPSGNIVYQDSPYTEPCWHVKSGLTYNGITSSSCCCKDASNNYLPVSDDTLFLKLVIDDVLATFDSSFLKVDPQRVYMAGHSNGCIAALATAAEYPESMAAVCCHAGFLGTPPADTYADNPVATWVVHGKQDAAVLYDGDPTTPYWSIPEMRDYLEDQNSCEGERTSSPLKDANGVVVGKTETSTGCKRDSTVELVTLTDSGHFPYQVPATNSHVLFLQSLDGAPVTVDTTGLAWDFCKAHKSSKKSKSSKTKKAKKSGKSR